MQITQEQIEQSVQYTKATIIDPYFWRQNTQVQETFLNDLAIMLNQQYGTNVRVELELNPLHYAVTGGGAFDSDENVLHMSKGSLMTFLHCYACALLQKGYEVHPVNWSHEVFRLAAPEDYESAVARGLFFFTPETVN